MHCLPSTLELRWAGGWGCENECCRQNGGKSIQIQHNLAGNQNASCPHLPPPLNFSTPQKFRNCTLTFRILIVNGFRFSTEGNQGWRDHHMQDHQWSRPNTTVRMRTANRVSTTETRNRHHHCLHAHPLVSRTSALPSGFPSPFLLRKAEDPAKMLTWLAKVWNGIPVSTYFRYALTEQNRNLTEFHNIYKLKRIHVRSAAISALSLFRTISFRAPSLTRVEYFDRIRCPRWRSRFVLSGPSHSSPAINLET